MILECLLLAEAICGMIIPFTSHKHLIVQNIFVGIEVTLIVESFVMFYRRYSMVQRDLLEFVTGKPNTRKATMFWCVIISTPIIIIGFTIAASVKNIRMVDQVTSHHLLNWIFITIFIICCVIYLYLFTKALLRVRWM